MINIKQHFIQLKDIFKFTYNNCPGATGFNVIQLKLPTGDREIVVEFLGIYPGEPLAPNDPGITTQEDGQGTTVKTHNKVNQGNVGWRYGFVTINSDDSRTYSETYINHV